MAGGSPTIGVTDPAALQPWTESAFIALGGNGDLSCLDTATGKIIWSLNLGEKFGGSNPHWGTSESPLILQDRLLVERWWAKCVGRRAQQKGWQRDLEERQRWRRVFLSYPF